jgi:hypothetical protein
VLRSECGRSSRSERIMALSACFRTAVAVGLSASESRESTFADHRPSWRGVPASRPRRSATSAKALAAAQDLSIIRSLSTRISRRVIARRDAIEQAMGSSKPLGFDVPGEVTQRATCVDEPMLTTTGTKAHRWIR